MYVPSVYMYVLNVHMYILQDHPVWFTYITKIKNEEYVQYVHC